MSLQVPTGGGGPQLFKAGQTMSSGIEEAVIRNIQAVSNLSDLVRTSFGPQGRNKIIVNHLERTFVTSDAATILKELEVVHPAAKVLVQASQQQEAEVGDRTNLVLMLAGELLKKAEYLLTMGLHPSEIIQGYELAKDKIDEILPTLEAATVQFPLEPKSLALALTPALATKQYGNEDLLAKLVAEAALMTLPKDASSFNVDSIRVVKIMGGGLSQSRVVKGMVFNREPEGVIKSAKNAKVAVFTSGIDIAQTETKGTVLLKSADELMGFSKGEEKHMEKIFQEIADSGVKVVVAGSGIGELALHFLNRYNILVVKILSKFELRRLCRVMGATPLARLGAPLPEEMGNVDVVETIEVGGDRVIVFRQEEDVTRTATVVIRGATTTQMDDIERAIDDGVNVVKGIIKDQRLIPGAGATEIELAKRVAEYGEKTPGLAQHAIKRFADSLEVVPRTLAENAGLDATEVLSRLYAAHSADNKGLIGVNIEAEKSESGVLDVTKSGIYDLLVGTEWAIRYATQAAITILQVDAIIMSKAAGIAPPKQNPNWDED